MHDQPLGVTQAAPRRVEHMEFGRLFGVEAEHRGRGGQADGHRAPARQIEPTQSERISGLADAVDALPKALQHTSVDERLEAPAREVPEYLCAGGYAALGFEEREE